MTSQLLTQLLQALSLLSVLLLVGTFLRAKVKLFQSLYLPAYRNDNLSRNFRKIFKLFNF